MPGKPLALIVTDRAWKELGRVPAVDRGRIMSRMEAYAADPDHPRHDVVRLVGRLSGQRLRVGDWRVIFTRSEQTVEVTRVLHRREAYR